MKIGQLDCRAFCVTLPEMPEKWEFIAKHFAERGLTGVEQFVGIHGTTSGLRTVFPYERDAPGSGWNIGAKPIATALSFLSLYNCCSHLPDTHFLFLEYDVCFPENWRQRTENALCDTPADFDMLYLGSCCTDGGEKRHIKGEVFQCAHILCGHAIIVAKKAIPTVLATQRKFYAPWDIALHLHTHALLKVYAVLPRICGQFLTDLPA